MKQKFILIGALVLLIVAILFMAWDLFFNKSADNSNPYAYDIKEFRTGDTSQVIYEEIKHFDPGLGGLYGIATDRDDAIYITGEKGIAKYDSFGKQVLHFKVGGLARSIHVAGDGKIYLGVEGHLEIWDHNGKFISRWDDFGSEAIITSIAVSGMNVYIADAGNKIVYQYDLDGNRIRKIGEKDPARKIPGFIIPSPYFDLAIGYRNELWVVNSGRHLFEQFNADGDLVTTWGAASMTIEGFCGCCNPSHFAILSDASFVTSEKGIERIKLYWPDGTFRGLVAGTEAFIEGTTGLDLAVDSHDRVILLDPGKKLVRFFSMKTTIK